jgi:hypothetical protein
VDPCACIVHNLSLGCINLLDLGVYPHLVDEQERVHLEHGVHALKGAREHAREIVIAAFC